MSPTVMTPCLSACIPKRCSNSGRVKRREPSSLTTSPVSVSYAAFPNDAAVMGAASLRMRLAGAGVVHE